MQPTVFTPALACYQAWRELMEPSDSGILCRLLSVHKCPFSWNRLCLDSLRRQRPVKG